MSAKLFASTKFNMTRDINGYNGFGVQPTYDIQGCSLTASAAQTFTVPSNYGQWIAVFSYTPGSSIFVDFSGVTARVPGGTVGAITTCLNPAARQLPGGTTFSVITGDATSPFITVEYQVIPPYQNQGIQVGILQTPLGINITNNEPLTSSPFTEAFNDGEPFPPPTTERMITETGILMITESTLYHMITE